MQIQSFFGSDYCPMAPDPNAKHFARLSHLYAGLAQDSRFCFSSPEPMSPEVLSLLHQPDYVRAMQQGIPPLCNSAHLPWTPSLYALSAAMLGGQLAGARSALKNGVALNLALGFHHAHPARGGGFCVFNGLAAVAAEHAQKQIVVLDCDEHGGDGTSVFAEKMTNLYNISIFGTRFGVRTGARTLALRVPTAEHAAETEQNFFAVLEQALDRILVLMPDLVLYQAGADMHERDPKATLKLSTETLHKRDLRVFTTLKKAGIPLLCSFAGGYQSAERTAALYWQTADCLANVYSLETQ